MGFSVTFWGVRGTIPCPMASHLGFGGNTACVEVQAGKQRISAAGARARTTQLWNDVVK